MVYQTYGSPDKLELQEIDLPVINQEEVLVKVHAASLNWLDWHFLTGTPLMARLMSGLFKPKHTVLGVDLAGRVEAVGANVDACCYPLNELPEALRHLGEGHARGKIVLSILIQV
jgi:NADPH:quinone reductase-like Zn-dependent oxidoreductase